MMGESRLPRIQFAASRVAGIMGKGGSSLSKVQAELQTLHSNIRAYPSHAKTLQAIFDQYPQRFRDTFYKKRRLQEAAEMIIEHDESLKTAVSGLANAAKGAFGAMKDLQRVTESSIADAMVTPTTWMTAEEKARAARRLLRRYPRARANALVGLADADVDHQITRDGLEAFSELIEV